MKISVAHRDFATDGGGERVTLSLLRALDSTGHDVDLRCLAPPMSAAFREIEGAAPATAGPENGPARPAHEFRRVRLRRAPPGAGARWLFAGTESDLLAVTDGGFVMERTDAPRALLCANSDLGSFREVPLLSARHLCHLLALYRLSRRPARLGILQVHGKHPEVLPGKQRECEQAGRCCIATRRPFCRP